MPIVDVMLIAAKRRKRPGVTRRRRTPQKMTDQSKRSTVEYDLTAFDTRPIQTYTVPMQSVSTDDLETQRSFHTFRPKMSPNLSRILRQKPLLDYGDIDWVFAYGPESSKRRTVRGRVDRVTRQRRVHSGFGVEVRQLSACEI